MYQDFGIYAADTDKTIYVLLRDSTTELAKTGLTFESAGVTCSYVLPRGARQAIALVTHTVTGGHEDGGFVEIDATNCKGLYRLDLPDAAIASGAYTIISIEFDGVIEESIQIPLHIRKVNTIQVSGTTQTAGDVVDLLTDIDTEVDEIHIAVNAITVTGSALNVVSEASANTKVTTGDEGATDYTMSQINNNIRHVIAAVGGVIDTQYQFDIGATGVPNSVAINGYLLRNPAGGITMDLYAWNYTGSPAFELIHANVMPAANSTTDGDYTANLLARNTEGGKVILRFYKTGMGTTTLAIDQLIVSYAESTSANIALIKTKTDFLPSATAGATGGVFIAGSNAATSITTGLTANIIGNLTGNITGNMTGDITGNLSGSVGTVTLIPDGAIAAAAVADIFSTTAITEAYAADGAAGTAGQILYLIQQSMHESVITDDGDDTSTRTVKKLDGSTTAATFSIDGDADTNPTTTTRAS